MPGLRIHMCASPGLLSAFSTYRRIPPHFDCGDDLFSWAKTNEIELEARIDVLIVEGRRFKQLVETTLYICPPSAGTKYFLSEACIVRKVLNHTSTDLPLQILPQIRTEHFKTT